MKQEGRTPGQAMNKMKQLCKDSQKFQKKIAGKQFLLGKYFDGQQATRKPRKTKKYTKSKIEKLLNTQEKIIGKALQFQLYEPLNNLWKSYTKDLLKNEQKTAYQSKTQEAIYLKLLRSDFHGAYITVVHSRIDSYIGLEGIIINQSLKTFKIITREHRILTLLKAEIIMQVEIQQKYYAINGNCLIFRAVDRAKIKFKNRKAERINLEFMGQLLKDESEH